MVAVRENLALNGRQRGEASGEASGLLRRGKLGKGRVAGGGEEGSLRR